MDKLMTSIKTGITVAIGIFVSKLLKLEYPFFVALAIMMPIQDNFQSSLKSSKYRMLGTVLGAIVGVICYFIKPESAIISGIGVALIVYLCYLFKWPHSGPIGSIVFIAIMVNLKGKNPIQYGFNRVIDTLIGVCVTLAVHFIMTFITKKKSIKFG